jgi:hypothetical protein
VVIRKIKQELYMLLKNRRVVSQRKQMFFASPIWRIKPYHRPRYHTRIQMAYLGIANGTNKMLNYYSMSTQSGQGSDSAPVSSF